MFLEEKALKIIGFYKAFCISMHPTTTKFDTYNDFSHTKNMLTRIRIVDEKNPIQNQWILMTFDDFFLLTTSANVTKSNVF